MVGLAIASSTILKFSMVGVKSWSVVGSVVLVRRKSMCWAGE